MKTIIFILGMLLGFNAFAGDAYCENHRNPSKCYANAINVQRSTMRSNLKDLEHALPADKFKDLVRENGLWAMNINNACTDDLACTYVSTKRRNAYLVDMQRNYKK